MLAKNRSIAAPFICIGRTRSALTRAASVLGLVALQASLALGCSAEVDESQSGGSAVNRGPDHVETSDSLSVVPRPGKRTELRFGFEKADGADWTPVNIDRPSSEKQEFVSDEVFVAAKDYYAPIEIAVGVNTRERFGFVLSYSAPGKEEWIRVPTCKENNYWTSIFYRPGFTAMRGNVESSIRGDSRSDCTFEFPLKSFDLQVLVVPLDANESNATTFTDRIYYHPL